MAKTVVIVVFLLFANVYVEADTTVSPTPNATALEEEEIKDLKQVIESLGRQLMVQQLFVEEHTRSEGDSGVKSVPIHTEGSHPFLSDSFAAKTPGNLWDAPTSSRALAVGPLHAVLNGVDFKIGRKIYGLKRPSTKNKNFGEVEDIPFPEVPRSVKNKHTVMEQIAEMKEYFKAFKNQDPKIRSDYERYFKPVLCYLEGWWSADVTSKDITSHLRYQSRWFNANHRARISINSGEYAHLTEFHPLKIISMKNSTPEYVKWEYGVSCHPIKYNLRRSDLVLIDDISVRLKSFVPYDQYAMHPAARFRISGTPGSHYNSTTGVGIEYDRGYVMELLDNIMQEIPGKDNYRGYLSDDSFGMYHDNMAYKNNTRLNTAHYHRQYKVEATDAMGISVVHRGFNDLNMWTAQTTNPNVAKMTVTQCAYDSKVHKRVCKEFGTRYTYAIPLEIVWMSPLLSWNPFDIQYIPGDWRKSPADAVTANHRNGGYSLARAYNGSNEHRYFITPYEFYRKGVVGNNTHHGSGVLDKHGQLQSVFATGTRMFINIPDVGRMRMRYPIMPIHDEGNTVWKELDALKEMVQNIESFAKYFETNPSQFISKTLPEVPHDEHFLLSTTHMDPPGVHNHDVYITPEGMAALSKNKTVTAYSSLNIGHQHQMDIKKDSQGNYIITSCDGLAKCWDGHNNHLYHQASKK